MTSHDHEPIIRFTARAAIPLVALLGAAVGLVAMLYTGAAEPTVINDPGAVVRFGLPAAKFVFNLAMSLTVGALLFALLILPRTQGRIRG
ncbi:copper resistance protein CopD, partial [Burkholderia multivorans]|uniref:hypothetical protein n=1 Tax=Burkholderia multivorans TaxID=87883 RepID=UPI000DB4209B